MNLDDEQQLTKLLTAARAGDVVARDELFRRCRDYLSIVARSQLASRLQTKVDSSDLVQQTMLEAYRGLQDFRGQTDQQWLAWLRALLNHNAIDFARRYMVSEKRCVARERSLSPLGADDSSPANEPPAPAESPSEILIGEEKSEQLASCLSRLAPDYHQVVKLRSIERLPFEEVAARMGRSRPAVQMLWTRAIQRLQQAMCTDST